jgi:hypothetical protein
MRNVWSRACLFGAFVVVAITVIPVEGVRADATDDDSQALTAETNAALMQAGQQANDALEQLMSTRGAISVSAGPSPNQMPLAGVPPELKQPITLSWNGSGEDLAGKIAAAVGYKFAVSGTKPATPAIVTMVFQQEPAIWALQRLGIRVRDVATVSVNPNTHEIDYSYNLMSAGTGVGITGSGD